MQITYKDCPYDNAVAVFKTIKTEFVKGQHFNSTTELQRTFSAYSYWYNNKRLHSSLDYLPPVELKNTYPLIFCLKMCRHSKN
ncbi:IS3 family transposase [Gilliamella apicola]|uniref:IS3 family transposase n=1 Tax=Gilliamella sp. Bif1-4 TaxID=3120233 RepID=UPI0009BEE244